MIQKLVLILGALISQLFTLSGCVKGDLIGYGAKSPTRTVIFYMGGDNDLSGELPQKLKAIQRYASESERVARGEIKLLVYQDGLFGGKLYRVNAGVTETVGGYGTENSATPETLGRVLRDCIFIAPSDRYGLVVFSHASGWLPAGALNASRKVTRSIVTDGRHEMDIREFAAAIPAQTFDWVVFEACFMAGVEVACELREKVPYMLASSAEMLSPGFLHIYPELLTQLCSPQTDPETSLCNAAKVYFDYYNLQNGNNRSATISVIRLQGIDDLAQLCNRVAPQLAAADPEQVQYFDRNGRERHLFFDLRDAFRRYVPDAVAELDILLTKAIAYSAATPQFLPAERGFTIEAHCGLTFYIPQKNFPHLNQAHGELQWGLKTKMK